jgi:hypothetical protein
VNFGQEVAETPTRVNARAGRGRKNGGPRRLKLLFRAIVAVMVIVPSMLALQAVAGQAASAATLPVVTGISPDSGPTSGGNTVTITGSNFTATDTVVFGSSLAVNTEVSSTEITATVPPEAAGTVDVTVGTYVGYSLTSAADRYTYVGAVPAPTVTGVSPDSGPNGGRNTVTITGTGFTGATSVSFGSALSGNFSVDSDTQITALAPANPAGTVDVTVVAPGGDSVTSPADQYTYVDETPTVTGVSPDSGSTAGGTTVTVTGTNFTGALGVNFGLVGAENFTVNSDTSITATVPTVPASSAGKVVDVTVTGPNGTSATSAADQFTYQPPAPACTNTVTGTNTKLLTVTNGLTCLVNATQEGQVTVAAGAALSVTNSTVNGTVTATSPSGITYCGATESGTLSVTGATGPVILGGTLPDGTACAADTIPSAVSITGATAPVTVTGLNQHGTLTLENDSAGVTLNGSQVNGLAYVENNAATAPVEITVSGNTVTGSLYCTGNNPAPSDNGIINTVSGTATGQCAGIAQR